MKTVITQEIDNQTIIIGFGEPSIDAVETKLVVKPLIEGVPGQTEGLPEIVEIKNVHEQMLGKSVIIRQAIANLKNPLMNKIPAIVAKNIKAKEGAEVYNKALEQDLIELWGIVRNKKIELMQTQAVFHAPKKGEYITAESEELNLMVSMFEETKLDKLKKLGCEIIDGAVKNSAFIPDLRGKTFNVETAGTWEKIEIKELGVSEPVGGILQEDLTPEQNLVINEQAETARVSGLTVEEKQIELDQKIGSVVGQASAMRSGLEIQGVSLADALTQSQDFYNTEVAKLNDIYGV